MASRSKSRVGAALASGEAPLPLLLALAGLGAPPQPSPRLSASATQGVRLKIRRPAMERFTRGRLGGLFPRGQAVLAFRVGRCGAQAERALGGAGLRLERSRVARR